MLGSTVAEVTELYTSQASLGKLAEASEIGDMAVFLASAMAPTSPGRRWPSTATPRSSTEHPTESRGQRTMAQPRKVIITSAVTGAIHTPSMSPHLPVSQDEIADAAIGAAEAGAAILHLHTRDPEDGRPSQEPEHFAPVLEKVAANTESIVNITTGGSPHMSVEERMRPVATFKPELASLNMGR